MITIVMATWCQHRDPNNDMTIFTNAVSICWSINYLLCRYNFLIFFNRARAWARGSAPLAPMPLPDHNAKQNNDQLKQNNDQNGTNKRLVY